MEFKYWMQKGNLAPDMHASLSLSLFFKFTDMQLIALMT